MEEIWKDVVGFEDAYQVSSLGNVRSKDRTVVTERYKNRKQKGQNIKLRYDKDGYLTFNAKWNGKNKILKVHREVAKCFIENNESLPCIDHIDGVRDNNVVTNLRWCTSNQNANFDLAKKNKSIATKNSYIGNDSLREKRRETFMESSRRPIEVYVNGKFLNTFNSQREAARELGISESTISACIYGRIKSSKGLTFNQIKK